MLFARRRKPGWRERLRVSVWPRHSWRRSLKYVGKRIVRLSATPHAVAAGVAAGVCASTTPFLGLQFILSFLIAVLIGGNLIAAAFGSFFGNPLTYPFIWASTFRLGSGLLGEDARAREAIVLHPDNLRSVDGLMPILKPMVVGSIPLGIATGLLFYLLVYVSVTTYQRRRRRWLQERRQARTLAEVADAASAPARIGNA